ncbi:hypothetical protein CAPI_02395 [Corynebacterium capitovis DSM 44611]|uniref:Rv3212 family protein n=1 Tax=Corynebacterium capitovis TaxID=131081 RepID=UPI000360B381|nr:hypothetical protein [Corynebacterium capitovis]WKD57053.1 hypothetical protein CAPI_02395 [Corynebacterium capitovis DSM 44611]
MPRTSSLAPSRAPRTATSPLRRTRGDIIAAFVLAAISAVAVASAIASAPIRSAHLAAGPGVDEPAASATAAAPAALAESFRLPDTSPSLAPVIAGGRIITYAGKTLTATTPEGDTAWTYTRDVELCSLGQAWGKVIAVYRNNAGCGDVVAINASTGAYAGTRSAVAPDDVAALASNDRVGYSSPSRVEVWRSDLVRTVEYGAVEAPQEAGMQPNQCAITSALTRTDLLAVTETCDDGAHLRLQSTTPDDSRKPEIEASVDLSPSAYLVAVGQEAAAVYDPDSGMVLSFGEDGASLATSPVPDLGPRPAATVALNVADLPHHMTYEANGHLILFNPTTLGVESVMDGVRGTGFSAEGQLVVPVDGGLSVADEVNVGAAATRLIPVDRGGYKGPVSARGLGAVVVEKRGEDVVVLAPLSAQ